jgi:nidogen-like
LLIDCGLFNKAARCSAILGVAGAFTFIGILGAAEVTIPNSALVSSTSLYTSTYGDVVVTTAGGNAANAGDPSGRNDDGFRGPIDLGFSLNFFGTNYTQFFINNNGNVSFGNGIDAFVPEGPTGATSPVISPFFGDVDTRGANSGVVHFSQLANEDIITWDHVGYFSSHDDKLNTFQLVLRGPGFAVPSGEGQVGFFYTDMQWDTTDTSQVAAIGFGDGSGNSVVLQGSTLPGTANLTQNHHIWFDLSDSGVPVTPPPVSGVPEPGSVSLVLAGAGGLLLAGRKYLVRN